MDGHERPFDWRALADAHGIAQEEARELLEQAARQAGPQAPRREQERIYIALLGEERRGAELYRPAPGKVARTMRLGRAAASTASGGRRTPGHRPGPGKVSLTSYLVPVRGANDSIEEGRADAATRLLEACLAVGLGNRAGLDALDRQRRGDELDLEMDAPAPRQAGETTDARRSRRPGPPPATLGVSIRAPGPGPSLALAERDLTTPAGPPSTTLAAARRQSGLPLPEPIRRAAEALIGTDLSEVVLHLDDLADQAAAAIGASAFAVGPHLFFRRGRYQPGSDEGRRRLLHELTHVAQWVRGDIPIGDEATVASPDHPLEREADRTAHRLAPAFARMEWGPGTSERRDRTGPLERPTGGTRQASPVVAGPLVLRDTEGAEQVCVAAPTQVPEGGVDIRKVGVIAWDGQPRIRLRASDSTQADNVIGELSFNTQLEVLKRFPGDWYFVSTRDGKLGYVAAAHVRTDLPEPNADLHRVEQGQSAIAIAESYYREHADNWGQDLRFYVNALAWANRKQVPDTTTGWKEVQFKAGELIWVPSHRFAISLRGAINSGSFSYNAADALGVAELAERLGQLWDDFKTAISLSGKYIPAALARHALQGLERAISALIDLLLTAAIVMAISTAIGAAIGSLAGGAGAAPGAAAGFEVGMALLDWMGLGFLVAWAGQALVRIGSAFGTFLGTVWNARGNRDQLDLAAHQLAEALGLLVGGLLEALVMYASARGVGAVRSKLAGTRFGQALGETRLGEWLSSRVRQVREGRARSRRPATSWPSEPGSARRRPNARGTRRRKPASRKPGRGTERRQLSPRPSGRKRRRRASRSSTTARRQN